MKQLLLPIIIIATFFSCKKHSNTEDLEKTKIVTYKVSEIDVEPLQNVLSTYFTEPTFVKLRSKDISTDFGKISKVKLQNQYIYILDQGIKSLVVYDKEGYAVGKVGQKGQGPNEYLDIADFDIDKQGYIYALDGRWDKLFIYDQNLNLVSNEKLPFEADKIQLLENGDYMFALSSWNKGNGEGYKIAITDKEFNLKNKVFKYDEFIDENYWISDYQLIRTNEYIIYNKSIDNHIHLFSLNGDYIKTILLDFGKENVQNQQKKNIEKYIRDFDNYTLLKDFPIIYGDLIMGTLWEHRNSKIFLLDTKQNKMFKSGKITDSNNTFYTGFSDSILISFIDPDFYRDHIDFSLLKPEIIEHLEKEEFVLTFKNKDNKK